MDSFKIRKIGKKVALLKKIKLIYETQYISVVCTVLARLNLTEFRVGERKKKIKKKKTLPTKGNGFSAGSNEKLWEKLRLRLLLFPHFIPRGRVTMGNRVI